MRNLRQRGPLNKLQLEAANHDRISLLTSATDLPSRNTYHKVLKVARATARTNPAEPIILVCIALGSITSTCLTLGGLQAWSLSFFHTVELR